jgi:hypothetical protein
MLEIYENWYNELMGGPCNATDEDINNQVGV